MSDKGKSFAMPPLKTVKLKRQSIIPSASSVPRQVSASSSKKNIHGRSRSNKNVGEGDITINKPDISGPEFEAEYRQIAYNKFMRTMLEDCLVDEKIKREETHIDIQMAQLADRFRKTMDQLDKTNRRLKEISFVVEQKRLLDLKSQDFTQFHEIAQNYNTESILRDLAATEQNLLDKLETKNVDFGYDKESGHMQLLDAVNDTIQGLEEIKKHSNLDETKFREYEKTQASLNNLEKQKLDLGSLREDFEAKFPNFSEKLLREASEKIAQMIEYDEDEED